MFGTRFKAASVVSAAAAVFTLSLYTAGAAGAAGTTGGGTGHLQLEMPKFDAAHGRMLFASKGCVVCHSINGVGGTDAPKLDASTMGPKMDPFDFAAKMWHGAPAMIAMQKEELGAQIQFTGDELADIIAFAHSPAEQKKFSEADIPKKIKEILEEDEMSEGHNDEESAEHKN